MTNPGCLGQMAQRYCGYCSERCPVTALCVLILMGEYLRCDLKVPPSQESTEAAEPLTIPPDEP
jgi:ferredoxin